MFAGIDLEELTVAVILIIMAAISGGGQDI